jgi:hypothetical protein
MGQLFNKKGDPFTAISYFGLAYVLSRLTGGLVLQGILQKKAIVGPQPNSSQNSGDLQVSVGIENELPVSIESYFNTWKVDSLGNKAIHS